MTLESRLAIHHLKTLKYNSNNLTLVSQEVIAMSLILCLVLAAGGFWYWTLIRGRRFVRASIYLMYMEHPDATPELCNKRALSVDTYAAQQLTPGALVHCQEMFGGIRVALVSEARLQGFNG
jgi:hypothetical protein